MEHLVPRIHFCKFHRKIPLENDFSLNFGLLGAYVLGMTQKSFDLGPLKSSAFVVAFPILGSILQLIILPFVYDSPDSLGIYSNTGYHKMAVNGCNWDNSRGSLCIENSRWPISFLFQMGHFEVRNYHVTQIYNQITHFA